MVTPEDIQRLESKMDQIIEFFNIGKQPRRSKKELKDHANAIILDLQKKSRSNKK